MLTNRWVLIGVAVALAGALWVGPSQAGYQSEYSVSIGSGYACGSLGTARNSANSVEYIRCGVYAENNQNSQSVYCSARAADATTASCNTHWQNAPALLPAMAAMNGDSYVCFTFNDNGHCTTLSVSNGSYFAPKQ